MSGGPNSSDRGATLSKALAAKFSARQSEDVADDAIDDSADADEDLVDSQRQVTLSRLEKYNSAERLRHKVIPFHWAPMLTPLTEADVDACVTLEDTTVSGGNRHTPRDQIEYCLRRCGGVCYGFFNSVRQDDAVDWWIETIDHGRPVEIGRDSGEKRVMFAHVIATLGADPVVTENDMKWPDNWREEPTLSTATVGHRPLGRTICIQSFRVCPAAQGVGIGKTTLKSYIELTKGSLVADRIALVCKPSTASFFERLGFKNKGRSDITAGGEELQNMVLDIRLKKPDRKTNALTNK